MKLKNQYKGILYIILSAFCFALMDMFVRMAGELPSIQKSFFRNFVAAVFACVILIKEKKSVSIGRESWGYLILRSLFGTLGILCNFYAVDHLALADASMLNKMSPFFAVVFSVLLLREKVSIPQITMVLGAFLGSLFVVTYSFKYGFGSFSHRTSRRNWCRGCLYYGAKAGVSGSKRSFYCVLFLYVFLCCDIAVADF